jgi:hypothetical protein
MKHKLTYLLFAILLFAQFGYSQQPVLPLSPNASPLFGKDIVINDQPTEDQRNVAICSAFNGWLFAFYTYTDEALNPAIAVMKSTDHGITWAVLSEGSLGPSNCYLHSLSIIATGNTASNLKVYIAFVESGIQDGVGVGYCYRLNGETGDYEGFLVMENSVNGIALSTDYPYPANHSDPFSIGILYSISWYLQDSLAFRASADGGMSLSPKVYIPVKMKRCGKVALSYGRSNAYPDGRYFATWEEHSDTDKFNGHIFTAYTEPYFNSPFTAPVNLDSLNASAINLCRKPKIATQYGTADNANTNVSEVILFEKYDTLTHSSEIIGFSNTESIGTSNFTTLQITDTTHANRQPSLIYNPYDSTFLVTYFDSSLQRLPLLKKNFNLQDPSNWSVISSGYNDTPDLQQPNPSINIDHNQQKALCGWSYQIGSANPVALFDSEKSTYTGNTNVTSPPGIHFGTAYPNPCSTHVTILVDNNEPGPTTTIVYDITGKPVLRSSDYMYSSGIKKVSLNVVELSNGLYHYAICAHDQILTGNFVVTK